MIRKILKRWRAIRRLHTLAGDSAGTITLEFAVTIPVLTLLALGIYEFGSVTVTKSIIESAAKAGVQYGTMDHSAANDVDGMVQAALNDIGETAEQISVQARQYCSCPETGELSCSSACGDGAYSPMYVEVNVQTTKDMLFTYPGLPESMSLSASNQMRVR